MMNSLVNPAADGAPSPAASALAAGVVMSAKNLSVVYKTKRGSITALEALNLSVDSGEFVSIVGPSGCGKSTFLKIAAGLLGATNGQLELYGEPMAGPRRDVGVVFQKPNLMPWKTVLDNALINARVLGLDRNRALIRANKLLETVGLTAFKDNYPWELSGGMQQRVGIVRGLVHDPKLLLMDEPFAALDAMTREHMTLELQRLWLTTRKSVVFITHSIPEAVFLSDRILVMSPRPGRIIDEVTVDLPRPRGLDTMASVEFGALCNRLRQHFTNIVGLD
jgi:NitT/TauT family transport system ATP-binding protein